jgi:hypothetical protein
MDLDGATDDSTRKIMLFHRPIVAIRRILFILFILSKTAPLLANHPLHRNIAR